MTRRILPSVILAALSLACTVRPARPVVAGTEFSAQGPSKFSLPLAISITRGPRGRCPEGRGIAPCFEAVGLT
jgi:hypothetical protein